MKFNIKKIFSCLLTLSLVSGFITFTPTALAIGEQLCDYPSNDTIINISDDFVVFGSYADGASTADILVDGAVAETDEFVSESDGSFSKIIDTSAYDFGVHKIEVASGNESVERYVHFSDVANKEERGTNYTGGSGATSSNFGGWGCSQSSNLTVNNASEYTITQNFQDETTRIGRTYNKHKDGYIRVTLNNNRTSETIDTGVFELNCDFALTGDFTDRTGAAVQLAVRDRGGNGGYYLLDNLVYQENNNAFFMDGTPLVSGKIYKLKIFVDLDKRTRTYIVDDKIILNNAALSRNDVLTELNHFYFELTQGAPSVSSMTINNLNLYTHERYPIITAIDGEGIFSDNQTAKDLYRTTIPVTSNAVHIKLSGDIDASCITDENITLTKDGTVISSNAALIGKNVIKVTTGEAFATGVSYKVTMNNLSYSFKENNSTFSKVFPKSLTTSFECVPVFDIQSPKNNAEYMNGSIPFIITVPDDCYLYEISLDGKEISQAFTVSDTKYTMYLDFADIPLGTHTIKAVVRDGKGVMQTKTVTFVTSKILASIREGYPTDADYFSPTLLTKLDDGADNDGKNSYKITVSEPNNQAVISLTPVPELANTTVVIEADIKRDEMQNIWLEADGNQNGTKIYGAFSFDKQFVTNTGALLDTGITVDTGWHNYKIESDLKNKYSKIYFDSVLVKEGYDLDVGNIGMPDNITLLKFQSWCESEYWTEDRNIGLSFDNVRVYEKIMTPEVSVQGFSINGTDFEYAVDGTVSALS